MSVRTWLEPGWICVTAYDSEGNPFFNAVADQEWQLTAEEQHALLASVRALVESEAPAEWRPGRGDPTSDYALIESAHHGQYEDMNCLFTPPGMRAAGDQMYRQIL